MTERNATQFPQTTAFGQTSIHPGEKLRATDKVIPKLLVF
jgi:hypothetical protein